MNTSKKYLLKVILFTVVIASLATVGSYLVPVCANIAKIAIVAVLVEIGYLVYTLLFGVGKENDH